MYEPWMDNILIFGDIEDYKIHVNKCDKCNGKGWLDEQENNSI